MRHTTTISILIVITLALGTVGCGGKAVEAAPASTNQPVAQATAPASDTYTPILITIDSRPQAFKMTDKKFHLVYEVRLTNGTDFDQVIDRFEVRDPDRQNRTLFQIAPDLITQVAAPGKCTLNAGALEPHHQCLLLIHIIVDTQESVPQKLAHVVFRPSLPDGTLQMEPAYIVDVIPNSVVLYPPLSGGRWLVYHGCCTGEHRRLVETMNNFWTFPERFAIDFYQLDEANRLADSAGPVLGQFEGFDEKILAAADGVVVDFFDKATDNQPGTSIPMDQTNSRYGNFVVIALTGVPNTFLLYAHIENLKVVVQKNEPVHRGQVIGLIGNTGASVFPHLHFAVINRYDKMLLATQSLPFVFTSFTLYGSIDHPDDTIMPAPTLTTIESGPQIPVQFRIADNTDRASEMPSNLDIVTFDGWGTYK
jgi:hypothetical protein